jgi:hypothetical protein
VTLKCLTRQLQTDGRPGFNSGFVSFLTTIILLRNKHTLLPDRRVEGVIRRGAKQPDFEIGRFCTGGAMHRR